MNIDIETLKNYINDLEEKSVPLTKTTTAKSKQVVDTPVMQQQDIKKQKRPYTVTDKKKEQLVMAREKKNANDILRGKQKKLESAKLLLENELKQPKQELPSKPRKEQSDTESEDEVIYIKMPKKKPTKKQVVIQDDSSSSESEANEPVHIKPKVFGKSHRNKKSVVKIHSNTKEERQQGTPQPFVNYFCD